MIQSITQYQQLAKRTCPDLGSIEENLLHMKLGVYTEIGELLDLIKKNIAYNKPKDRVNIGEEIADIAWYISNEAYFKNTILPIKLSWSKENIIPLDTIHDVIKNCEDLIGYYANHFVNEGAVAHIFNPEFRLYLIKEIADYFELDFMQILTNNIDKLRIRYPEKFTSENALNRNLNSEREQLEK